MIKRLSSQPDKVSPEDLRSLEKDLSRYQNSVEGMLQDVLSLRPDQKPKMSMIDLAAFVESITDDRAQIQPAHQTKVVSSVSDIKFYSDRARLHRVLDNLVRNAWEAAGPEGQVTIATLVRDGALRFSVANTGKWIPEEKQHQIFEPFYTSDKEGGTGLGLFAVRRLTESLSGQVECESSPGRTKFIVTLPYTFRESASLEGKHSVAIIDDNVYILQAWQKAMSGAEVKVFRDSATAGQYAKEYGWPFSITIVDLHLQDGTTGIDLATELREGSKSLFFLSTNENVESCPGWMTLIGKDLQSIDDLLQLQQAA